MSKSSSSGSSSSSARQRKPQIPVKSSQQVPQTAVQHRDSSRKGGVCFFISLLLYMITMLFLYGFLSGYYIENSFLRPLNNIPHLLMETVFVLLGFGLFLTSSAKAKLTGLTTALFVVSFNYLVGALLQELWFEIFFRFRDTNLNAAAIAPNAQNFWDRGIGQNASPSYMSFKLANLCSISYLVGMVGYNGRVGISAVGPSLIIFNILFYLNFFLNALLSFSTVAKETSLRYLDDYGTYLVYLFGGVYGLIVCVFTKNKPESGAIREKSIISSVMTLLGSFFLFATFIFTSTGIIDFTGTSRNYKFNAQAMIILFSLVSSILGNFIGCAISNRGMLSIESIAVGALPGGIMVGALAGELQNFGAATIIGLASGLLTGIWMSKVHPKLNRTNIIDTHGLIGPVLIVAFIGTFIIPASIIIQYYWKRQILPLFYLNETGQTQFRNAQYQLAYFGVTAGIALFTGLILGVLAKISNNDSSTDFSDNKSFIHDFGLYDGQITIRQNDYIPETQQHFQDRDDVV